jgi:2-polyprenyl-3-methyl-5-hydroxy-6-metoxy-1,4-benzoquinol methylase
VSGQLRRNEGLQPAIVLPGCARSAAAAEPGVRWAALPNFATDECGSVLTEGAERVTAEFWDKRAKKYDDEIRKHGAVYVQSIESAKSLLSIADVALDLGCGSGEYSLDIAPVVRHVHGIDTSTNMIALATAKASDRSVDNVSFHAVDIFARSLDTHGYTVVLAFSVLHLVEDIRAVVRRVHELLPTGGLFISETPCLGERGSLFRLLVSLAQKVKIAPPILSLTVAELRAEIAGAGFAITESEPWDRKNAVHRIVARKR